MLDIQHKEVGWAGKKNCTIYFVFTPSNSNTDDGLSRTILIQTLRKEDIMQQKQGTCKTWAPIRHIRTKHSSELANHRTYLKSNTSNSTPRGLFHVSFDRLKLFSVSFSSHLQWIIYFLLYTCSVHLRLNLSWRNHNKLKIWNTFCFNTLKK